MKKIGIMGGTFNPIHLAHLAMAQAAFDEYGLDRVLFMPSKNPPHKNKENIVSDAHRERMIRLAIEGVPEFVFSDFELKREGTTYTSDTLELLCRDHPEWHIFFIIGGDSLMDFDKWHKPKEISKRCTILAVPRGRMDFSETKKVCLQMENKFEGDFLPVPFDGMQISSEKLREKINNGISVTGQCPRKVIRYIALHGLYGARKYRYQPGELENGRNYADLCYSLSSTLKPERYRHSCGVANTAFLLACAHKDNHYKNEGNIQKPDPEKAKLAGYLHDCAKYMTGKEMRESCEKNDIPLTAAERENPALIHGKLGAYMAKEVYGITDSGILSAIRYHTTGKPQMTLLEKILYVADFIEPERNMSCMPYSLYEIRKTCFEDLDDGLLMILESTMKHLEKTSIFIDEMTKYTYEYYKKERG